MNQNVELKKYIFFKGEVASSRRNVENVENPGERVVDIGYNNKFLNQVLLIWSSENQLESNVCGSTPVQLMKFFFASVSLSYKNAAIRIGSMQWKNLFGSQYFWGQLENLSLALLNQAQGSIFGSICSSIFDSIFGSILGSISGSILGSIFGSIFGSNSIQHWVQ